MFVSTLTCAHQKSVHNYYALHGERIFFAQGLCPAMCCLLYPECAGQNMG